MPDENLEITRAAYDALNRRDLEAFVALIDPEVEFGSLIAESEGGSFSGHEGVREWWAQVANSLGGLHFEPAKILDLGESVCVELVVTGTVAGVAVPQRMWQSIVLRDGKPVWWGTYRTEQEALAALEAGA